MKYTLPELKYSYDALEPYIDAQTLELHHSKHHAGYVAWLNKALEWIEKARETGDFWAVKGLKKELAFHYSGHILHSLYWENMSPEKTQMSDLLSEKINETFWSFETFEKEFKSATALVEASGWGLLVKTAEGELEIVTIEKHQDLALMNSTVLIACDVWEHAYYLKYQNRRPEYIDNFFNVINWEEVSKRLEK